MNGTRLEIFTNGEWKDIELFERSTIKYNKLVNTIGDINSRQISGSNTFSIISTYKNREVLGINVFNKGQLAEALNSKYEAKYYVEEKVFQTGFIVINQSDEDIIKLNFIDGGLELVDNWGSTSYRQLLTNEALSIPTDYKEAISEMQTFSLPTDSVITPLSEVGTRGYHLALFPHNLNVIGDGYMVDVNDERPDNSINPYQSRPIFNSKALFDLATLAYGYTPIFDASVDWDSMAKTYIVPSGLSDNFTDEGATNAYSIVTNNGNVQLTDSTFDRYAILTTNSRGLVPNDILGWIEPESNLNPSYLSEKTVFKPNLETLPSGIVQFTVQGANGSIITADNTYAVYSNQIFGAQVIFKSLIIENAEVNNSELVYSVNKTQLYSVPAGADEFIGIFATVQNDLAILNFQITETFLPIESVSYDERGQFESQTLNLTYATPNETVKELLVGLMKKDGILMNIDADEKTVTFFNYSRYLSQREAGQFTDFSDYLLEEMGFSYNTDFGNSFAKQNEIGLSNPFKGNTFFLPLDNNGQENKLKDFGRNLLENFKDVEAVNRIPNTTTPYTEFTNTGLGLVYENNPLGVLTQIRFVEEVENNSDPTFTTQGTITGLYNLQNVNYRTVPTGITAWYQLVGSAIKASPKFLVPVDIIKNVDITSPIYIEQLGGFYIIEEIKEYENSQTIVVIKVIRLIDSAEFSDDFSNAFNI